MLINLETSVVWPKNGIIDKINQEQKTTKLRVVPIVNNSSLKLSSPLIVFKAFVDGDGVVDLSIKMSHLIMRFLCTNFICCEF